ncbi:class I SAM-dependent methyltransferase [Ornithinimicrobium panacihumi]|uniref:class I SAM-dependent methyltransferase n=1 Tax=Ornithinimicrobium panacihumi TaxID=2008449 RepID=UPI003F8CC38D
MDAADFYTDLVVDAYALLKGETFDADRYADFVRSSGEPALEVGCGDGHPLLELRRRGLDVDGLDSSADMLDRAQEQAETQGIEVSLHHARMEQMDLPRRYRSIYLAGPTFNLLPDDEVALGALKAFRRHLEDDGRVLVPLWVPEPTPPEQLGAPREVVTDEGDRLRYTAVSEELDHKERTRTTHVRYERISPGGESEAVEREWIIHWQTRASLQAMCTEAGLTVADVRDEVGTPDEPGHQSTVVLARADGAS